MFQHLVKHPRSFLLSMALLLFLGTSAAAQDGAAFEEFEVPNEARVGKTFPITVKMRNTGSNPWTDVGGYRLALEYDGGSSAPMLSSDFPLPNPIVPVGTIATFVVDYPTPLVAGEYDFQMRMQVGGTGFGGFTSKVLVRAVCGPTDPNDESALEISVTGPEDVMPGQDFEVQVTLENDGQNCWATNDTGELRHVLGIDHPGATHPWPATGESKRFLMPSGTEYLRPGVGASTTFRVPLSSDASLTPGSYPTTFRMNRMGGIDPATGQSEPGTWFGPVFSLAQNIQVTTTATRKAEIVAVDLPPRIVPGTPSYPVRVTVRNTGSLEWTAGGDIQLGLWTANNLSQWGPRRYLLPANETVLPGEEYTFEFILNAYGVNAGSPTDDLVFRMIKSCNGGPVTSACGWFGTESASETVRHWDMSQQITVSGDQFFIGDPTLGKEFVVAGMSWIGHIEDIDDPLPNGPTKPQNQGWYSYDEAVTERGLRDMARMGATVVRVWLPATPLERTDNDPIPSTAVNELYLNRLLHFLDTAKSNGLRAQVVLFAPSGYWDLLQPVFGSEPFFGVQSRVLHDTDIRHFLMERYELAFTEANLANRPEIFAFDLWIEMNTGNAAVRAEVAEDSWNDYLDAKYLQASQDPCTAWGYQGQPNSELEAACAGSSQVFPVPTDLEMCTNGTWNLFTHDYRAFVETEALTAYSEGLNGVTSPNTIPGLRSLAGSTLITSSLGGIHREESAIRGNCGNIGTWIDPNVYQGLIDFFSIDSYPWNDLAEPFLGSTFQDRYTRMQMFLDYARGDKPIIVAETGYLTCSTQIAETTSPRNTNFPGDCDLRDQLQTEVYELAADAMEAIHSNGVLYFSYGDRRDRAFFGTVRLDGSQKPVYSTLPTRFSEILSRPARGPLANTITIDGCTDVLSTVELFDELSAYQLAAPGTVDLISLRAPGDDCQP